VEERKWRRAWKRSPVVEACSGGGKGEGRERSGDGGGRGEKRSGPRAASGGASDGGLKMEATGKRKRQSSERSMEARRRRWAARERERVREGLWAVFV
jgi:hypothetical protein